MSEMKMSDVFALPVYRGVQEVNIHNKERPCIISGTNTTVIARPKYIEATIHAINNHDRLVEENAKLREALEMSNEAFRDNLSKFAYKNESIMLECHTRNSVLLNQLKDKTNDK